MCHHRPSPLHRLPPTTDRATDVYHHWVPSSQLCATAGHPLRRLPPTVTTHHCHKPPPAVPPTARHPPSTVCHRLSTFPLLPTTDCVLSSVCHSTESFALPHSTAGSPVHRLPPTVTTRHHCQPPPAAHRRRPPHYWRLRLRHRVAASWTAILANDQQ